MGSKIGGQGMDTTDKKANVSGSAEGLPLVRISVRHLVEFVLRSGDLDNRTQGAQSFEAAMAGARLHRKLQKSAKGLYEAEVTLKKDVHFPDLVLRIEGRADGVMGIGPDGKTAERSVKGEPDGRPSGIGSDGKTAERFVKGEPDGQPSGIGPDKQTVKDESSPDICVDEIKCMYLDVNELEEPFDIHLAQAKCYAYILADAKSLASVGVRMTYVNLETEEVKRFRRDFDFAELEGWFLEVARSYHRWASWQIRHTKERDESMADMDFPFPYRPGQRGLAATVYGALRDQKNLMLMAPTGVGKTMSCLFPAVRALGQGMGDRIFYLTGKNETLSAPQEALGILIGKGLDVRAVRILSKEKICPLSEPSCNPDDCPYAKGHFDRVNDAVFELLGQGGSRVTDSRIILDQAEKWRVCPFEMELDVSSWCDVILCDYNYVFDPDAQLKRFFGEDVKGDYIFLIDEAHNLVDRGREMYSAEIRKTHVLAAKRLAKEGAPKIARALERVNKCLLQIRHDCAEHPDGSTAGIPFHVLGGMAPANGFSGLDGLLAAMLRLYGEMQTFYKDSENVELKERLLDFYFEVRTFVSTADYLDDTYAAYAESGSAGGEGSGAKKDKLPASELLVRLLCANPARRLGNALAHGRSAVFFSATLLPAAYYRRMLTDGDAKAVYAPSPFDRANRRILIGTDVSTKYTARGKDMYRRIARYISVTARAMRGNYLIFFPSYRMMRDVYRVYRREFDSPDVNYVCQSYGMSGMDREIFMENFYEDPEVSLAAFAVMGGMFSEGIDLAGTKLIGAVVVGTGIPQVSNEREILKRRYDNPPEDDPAANAGPAGFDYAYRYPGMNKVLQAAGRVIRTQTDRGVIVLLDSRFAEAANRRLFPREWSDAVYVTAGTVGDELAHFWK